MRELTSRKLGRLDGAADEEINRCAGWTATSRSPTRPARSRTRQLAPPANTAGSLEAVERVRTKRRNLPALGIPERDALHGVLAQG